jgi:hypothetical protein
MSFWTKARDTLESGASVAGNYFVPGSSLITSRLVSDGAKQMLNSNLGRIAQLGSGLAGAGVGSDFTTIPASTSNYSLANMFGSGGGDVPGAAPAIASPNADLAAPSVAPQADLNNMAATTPQATAPVFNGNTVSQGSNLPVDTTAGPINPSAPGSAYFAGQDAQDAAMGTVTPSANSGFLPSLMSGNIGDAASAAGNYMMDNKLGTYMVGSGLYDMYAKRQMAKKQDDLYAQNRNDIMGMYAPGSPEALAMQAQLDRADAAAGRNSQYGARATDYAANVAKFKMNALQQAQTAQNGLAAAQMGNQYGGLNSMFNNLAMYSLLNKNTH